MPKLEYRKKSGFDQKPVILARSNFGIFYPILMKFVSNCTNLRSGSPFLQSKIENFLAFMKNRKTFSEKTGFFRENGFSRFRKPDFWIQHQKLVGNQLSSRRGHAGAKFRLRGMLCLYSDFAS